MYNCLFGRKDIFGGRSFWSVQDRVVQLQVSTLQTFKDIPYVTVKSEGGGERGDLGVDDSPCF